MILENVQNLQKSTQVEHRSGLRNTRREILKANFPNLQYIGEVTTVLGHQQLCSRASERDEASELSVVAK